MLKTMCDVLSYYKKLKQNNSWLEPVIKERKNRLTSLNQLNLADSYVDFSSNYQTEGVDVGYLVFMPIGLSLRECINKLNDHSKNAYVDDDKMHVADFEADLILVCKRKEAASNNVYYRDISTGFFPDSVIIAHSFEEFVILAANFHKLSVSDNLNSEYFAKVIHVVSPNLGNDGKSCWDELTKMVSFRIDSMDKMLQT